MAAQVTDTTASDVNSRAFARVCRFEFTVTDNVSVGKLADVSLVWTAGPFVGLRLNGFVIWRGADRQNPGRFPDRHVSMPASRRLVQDQREPDAAAEPGGGAPPAKKQAGTFIALLRGIDGFWDLDPLKAAILAGYDDWQRDLVDRR